jgi:hypothetical protein
MAPIPMADVQTSPDALPLLLHHCTTGGITWRVLLRPEHRRAGESKVVELKKLGRTGKLLDQVIDWAAAAGAPSPAAKCPVAAN